MCKAQCYYYYYYYYFGFMPQHVLILLLSLFILLSISNIPSTQIITISMKISFSVLSCYGTKTSKMKLFAKKVWCSPLKRIKLFRRGVKELNFVNEKFHFTNKNSFRPPEVLGKSNIQNGTSSYTSDQCSYFSLVFIFKMFLFCSNVSLVHLTVLNTPTLGLLQHQWTFVSVSWTAGIHTVS